ncbi:MAG TPA: hypothetical protein VEU62_07295 [Bryobacterales bacterium]|nr:hypothetical protein [Bryobacterales bacterium]
MARQLEEKHLGGHYHVWFSQELNPIQNGDSSNPAWLYLTIDRAVKKGDVNHPKIRDVRAKLVRVVTRRLGTASAGLARELKREIRKAPLAMFRPQLWMLSLSAISSERVKSSGATPGWDERHVDDLGAGEFEVIVE